MLIFGLATVAYWCYRVEGNKSEEAVARFRACYCPTANVLPYLVLLLKKPFLAHAD